VSDEDLLPRTIPFSDLRPGDVFIHSDTGDLTLVYRVYDGVTNATFYYSRSASWVREAISSEVLPSGDPWDDDVAGQGRMSVDRPGRVRLLGSIPLS
jgi:hypothetical protein